MALYLGILLFSFLVTSILIVPFIDILYHLHFIQSHFRPEKISAQTAATPVGGGVLLISLVTITFALLFPLLVHIGIYITTVYPLKEELNIIFFTFISFGLLGLYDDLIKVFHLPQNGFMGLPVATKYALQVTLALVTGLMLYQNLHITIINLPIFGVLNLGWWFIPISAVIITVFSRGFDITDGMDGLACGVLLISLLAFWAVSVSSLDTTLSVFIALWIGSLLAFLYFNVFPARLWLGNAGSLAFGATLAVTGLLLGKTVALIIIGAVFIIEFGLHEVQQLGILIFHKKLMPVSPVHYYFQLLGWPESKIVMRAWLISILMALLGLWLTGTQ